MRTPFFETLDSLQKSGRNQEIESLNLNTGTEAPWNRGKNKDDRQRVLLKSPAARTTL
jgi:hypothetical protein